MVRRGVCAMFKQAIGMLATAVYGAAFIGVFVSITLGAYFGVRYRIDRWNAVRGGPYHSRTWAAFGIGPACMLVVAAAGYIGREYGGWPQGTH